MLSLLPALPAVAAVTLLTASIFFDARGRAAALLCAGFLAVLSLAWYYRRNRDEVTSSNMKALVGSASPVDWHRQFSEQRSLYKEMLARGRMIAWRAYAQGGFSEFEFGSEQQREFYGLNARMTFDEFRALIHPEDAVSVILAVEEMMGNERPDYEAFYRMRASSGEWRYMHSRGSTAIRSSDGSSIAANGLLQDVTDLLTAPAARSQLTAYSEQLTANSGFPIP